MSAARWTEADLVDLEVVLQAEEPLPEPALEERDRRWYLDQGRAGDGGRGADRRLLRRWLDFRRQEHFPAGAPGARFAAALAGARWLLAAAGLLLGAGYAAGVLAYTGERAINLLAALALLALLPLLLSLASVLALALLPARTGAGGGVTSWMVRRLLDRAVGPPKLAGRRGADWSHLAGRSRRYARVLRWLAFALAQTFALAFVLAAWLTVLVRGWVADLAFAWQTSAELTPATVHRLTTWLAFPWAWLEPPPTLAQVAGSRVALKEGLEGLANADLTVWWPYLVWAILTYALLPRLVLAAAAAGGRRRALAAVAFHDADSRRILRRLRSPHLDVAAGPEAAAGGVGAGLAGLAGRDLGRCVALVPREIARRHEGVDWNALAARHCGGGLEVREVALETGVDRAALADLARRPPATAVMVVQEGWRPCIEEVRQYLRWLRTTVGPERPVVVGLLGRADAGASARLAPADLQEWRRRLAELDDPLLEAAALEVTDA